jgi:hypothetical protein
MLGCVAGCNGLRRTGPAGLLPGAVAYEQGQDFADGGFLAGGFGQRKVGLDLVAVAPAVFVLDEVPGLWSGR